MPTARRPPGRDTAPLRLRLWSRTGFGTAPGDGPAMFRLGSCLPLRIVMRYGRHRQLGLRDQRHRRRRRAHRGDTPRLGAGRISVSCIRPAHQLRAGTPAITHGRWSGDLPSNLPKVLHAERALCVSRAGAGDKRSTRCARRVLCV